MAAIGFALAIPAIGATDVAVDLANIVYRAVMREFLEPPDVPFSGWWTGEFLAITNVENIVLSISPAHSVGTITYEVNPDGFPIKNRVVEIVIPSSVLFAGSTEYTWSLTMDITHGTFDMGPITQNYNTTGQIDGFGGGAVDPMTFITEVVLVAPDKPVNPTPTDAAGDIVLGTGQVSWDDGGGADTYDVYFGPTGDITLRSFDQAGTTWDIPLEVLFYDSGYEWRIDAVNAQGTTTGDTWTFDTLVYAPPLPSGQAPGAGGEHGGEGGKNNMVTVKRLVAAANNTIFFEDE